MVVRHLPGEVGNALRHRYWRRRLGGLGERTRIDEGVHFVNPEHIYIGSGCWIAANVFIGAGPASTEGRDVITRENASFSGTTGDVILGDDVYVAPGVLLNGHGGISIGENVSLAAGAKLYSSSHHYRGAGDPVGVPASGTGMRVEARGDVGRQTLTVGPVVIADESFVGSEAIVMPAVTIGPRTWLGAGGVAHRSLEPGRVYRAPGVIAADRG